MQYSTSHTDRVALGALLLAAAACSGGDSGVSPSGAYTPTVKFVGAPATAEVGTTVDVHLLVTNGPGGTPLSGFAIFVQADAGTANPSGYLESGADGTLAVRWTLGSQTGAQILRAYPGLVGTSQNLTVTAVAGPPSHLVALSAIDRTYVAGGSFSVQVEPRDRFDNRVVGKTVSFVVVEGGGSLTSTAGTSATWKLGDTAGTPQSLEARLEPAPPLTFRATTVALALNVASPQGGDRFVTGDSIQLRADASGFAGLVPDSVRWIANGSIVARGLTVTVSSLAVGTQVIHAEALGARATPIGIRVFAELGALYRQPPSASEIARIQQDFDIVYVDGAGPDETWAAYPGYAFNQQSTAPSRLAIIAKLDILRRQQFSEPLPFTGGRSVYDWLRANVGRLNMRLTCDNNSGGNGNINFSRVISHWDARGVECKQPFPNPFLASIENPLQLVVHEGRHSEAGDPRHTTCADNGAGDAYLENGSGYATGALYAMWVYKYSLLDDVAVRAGARTLAQTVLRRICSVPTHSNAKVEALVRELLGL